MRVALLKPYAASHSFHYNTPDTRKEARANGVPLEKSPYLIATSWEGDCWTYVHATPDEIVKDDLIDRMDDAFVFHAWPDFDSMTTRLRMHKRGKLVVDIVIRGTDTEDPTDVVQFDASAVGRGWLKHCPTLGDAVGELVNQVGLDFRRVPALVAEENKMGLTCDPADIDSVTVICLRAWNPQIDE